MKKILSLALVAFTAISFIAAQPQKMTYQTVVRDVNNELVVNQQVGVRINIVEDSINGFVAYAETHIAHTNANALLSIQIGTGTRISVNTFNSLDWAGHDYFVKAEIDPTGGTLYTISGTQQFLSVPYSFHAGSAKYVDTANYALNSNHTAYADTAVYANNAANAINAMNATYADSTQVADYAHNAGNANYAANAGSALTATNAINATYSDTTLYANISGNAHNAANATYADTAFFLMNAQNSDTAKFAYHSDTANYAANANHSIYADTSLYANNSANAINAISATYADSTQVANFAHNSDTAVYAYTANVSNFADSTRISYSSKYSDTALYSYKSDTSIYANASYSSHYADSTRISNYANLANSANYADTTRASNTANTANTANYADSSDYNHLANKPIGVHQGDLLYWESSDNSWHIVPPGNNNDVLTLVNNVPQWRPAGGGAQFSLPTVTTVAVGNISDSAATCDCSVTADGGFPVIAYGICWATVKNPTLNNSYTFDGSGIQNYTSYIENLNPAVTYYVRAYATNALGTAYGDTIGFTTSALPPTVTTTMASNVLNTSATTGGNVTFTGGLTVTERGVCWNTTGNPTMADSYTASGSGLGAFTITLTGLTPAVTYYVRAYAINSFDTAYGNEITFYTPTLPTVLTAAVNYSYGLTATCGGNVTSDGNAPVTARGVCWSTTITPTIADSHTTDGTGIGIYNSNITGLSAITKYYVRAYATNAYGTAYGDTISFTTIGLPPTVTTTAASSITGTTAVTGGNVTSDGGVPVTERGICYNTTGSPTMADNVITSGSGTGSFTTNMTGLSGTTTYYVRAYAINALDTAYGTVESFTTPFACGSKIKDYDNNEYNTLQLGTQCWMKENLKTEHYADGTSIALSSSSNSTVAYRYYPNSDVNNVQSYGYLYNWKAAMKGNNSSSSTPSGIQGICPNGWHLPSKNEYTQLTDYVSSQSQYWCGSTSTYIAKALASKTGWTSSSCTCCVGNTPSGNNATSFNALPAGWYSSSGQGLGVYAIFWCTTESSSSNAQYPLLRNDTYEYVYWGNIDKGSGFSVRCLKD